MFRKNKPGDAAAVKKKESAPSIVSRDINVLGNIISDGVIDFNGTIDGNIRCENLTIREHGIVRGEAVATHVEVHGTVKGLIRAKSVHLRSTCRIEGIVLHESIVIEDGAFIDGKCKRTDKLHYGEGDESLAGFLENTDGDSKVSALENIRLIR